MREGKKKEGKDDKHEQKQWKRRRRRGRSGEKILTSGKMRNKRGKCGRPL